METIKANSLMLNDWVKIKEPNKYAGAIGTIQSLSSLEGAYLAIYINDSNFGTFVTEVFCEDIEAIPLTAELLEKNGFKFNDCPIVLGWEQYGLTLYRGGDGILINCGQNVALIINYVHELQHALRLCLCGVDKEITL